MGDICDIANERDVGTFVCDNTIKTLTFNSAVESGNLYDLELQDGTIGTFILNGNDIVNITLTYVPNDATPINYVLTNIIRLLNEQDNLSIAQEAATSAEIAADRVEAAEALLSPYYTAIYNLGLITNEISIVGLNIEDVTDVANNIVSINILASKVNDINNAVDTITNLTASAISVTPQESASATLVGSDIQIKVPRGNTGLDGRDGKTPDIVFSYDTDTGNLEYEIVEYLSISDTPIREA